MKWSLFSFYSGFPIPQGAKCVWAGSVNPPVMDAGSRLGNITLNQHAQGSLSNAPSGAALAEPHREAPNFCAVLLPGLPCHRSPPLGLQPVTDAVAAASRRDPHAGTGDPQTPPQGQASGVWGIKP